MGASSVTGVSGYGTVAGTQKGAEHQSLGVGRLIGPRFVYVGAVSLTGTNAQQSVTITGGASSGNFTLTYAAQTTGNIAWNASNTTVQTALGALSTIGVGNVSVSGSNGGPWTVTFIGTLAGQAITNMTGNAAGLSGGSPVLTIASVTTGSGLASTQIVLPTATTSDYILQLTDQTGAVVNGITSFAIDSTTLVATIGLSGLGGHSLGLAIVKRGYANSLVTD